MRRNFRRAQNLTEPVGNKNPIVQHMHLQKYICCPELTPWRGRV